MKSTREKDWSDLWRNHPKGVPLLFKILNNPWKRINRCNLSSSVMHQKNNPRLTRYLTFYILDELVRRDERGISISSTDIPIID